MKIKIFLISLLFFCTQGRAFTNCGSVEVGAEWLYWQDYQDSMTYATTVNSGGVNPFRVDSEPLTVNFKPSNGSRVFAGYAPNHNPWVIKAQWTHLRTDNSRNTEINMDNFASDFIVLNADVFPLFVIFDQFQIHFSQLDSQWSSNFNYTDLDFTYSFYPRLGCEISPHFGLRGGWMKQSLKIHGFSPMAEGFMLNSMFSETYCGFGVEGGLYAAFNMGCGFSIIGALNTALLYSRISVIQELGFDVSEPTIVHTENITKHFTPWFDGFIGLNYEQCLGSFLFDIYAGWEQHLIVNSNLFSLYGTNYNLQGLTLGGSISF